MRVHSNIALPPKRQMPRAFGGYAIGTANPNTLHGGIPSKEDAMGLVGFDGMFSFFHDGASQPITAYYWSDMAQHWIALGPGSTINTQTIDPYSLATFSVPEACLIFLMAGTSAITDCWCSGSRYAATLNGPDLAP